VPILDTIAAAGIAAAIGDPARFADARDLMAWRCQVDG